MAAIDVLTGDIDKLLFKPLTLEDYRRGERLDGHLRETACLRMIELAAMERVYEAALANGHMPDSLGSYMRAVRPLIDAVQDPDRGLAAANALIRTNWELSVQGGPRSDYARRVSGTLLEADPEEANAAYSRLMLTQDHRLTAASEIALWVLYSNEHKEAVMFCVNHGMLPYLTDAEYLATYLANEPVRTAIVSGEDALYHLSNARDDIHYYMLDYAREHGLVA